MTLDQVLVSLAVVAALATLIVKAVRSATSAGGCCSTAPGHHEECAACGRHKGEVSGTRTENAELADARQRGRE